MKLKITSSSSIDIGQIKLTKSSYVVGGSRQTTYNPSVLIHKSKDVTVYSFFKTVTRDKDD